MISAIVSVEQSARAGAHRVEHISCQKSRRNARRCAQPVPERLIFDAYPFCNFTYSKSPGLPSMPARGGAIHEA
jgi:hypothetical protein